jgi:quinol monooxygenase YgiN
MLFPVLASLAATALAATPSSPAPAGPHIIVNVDVMPTELVAGRQALTEFVSKARKDRAMKSIVLIEQSATPNHFIIDESFASRAAYAQFVQSAYVRAFRASLFPLLGSPWDERAGDDLAP